MLLSQTECHAHYFVLQKGKELPIVVVDTIRNAKNPLKGDKSRRDPYKSSFPICDNRLRLSNSTHLSHDAPPRVYKVHPQDFIPRWTGHFSIAWSPTPPVRGTTWLLFPRCQFSLTSTSPKRVVDVQSRRTPQHQRQQDRR